MEKKSLTELRGIAQSLSIKWGFGDSRFDLIDKIKTKRDKDTPPAVIELPPLPLDQRYRSKPPSLITFKQEIEPQLAPYRQLGLHFDVSEDGQTFTARFNKNVDSGTMRQPPAAIIACVRRLMS